MKRRGRRTGLIAASLAAAALAHGASAQAATYPDAVVLVSGFTTTTPFTTPDPSCNGKEGGTWNVPTGPAAALKAVGNKVFTAPVRHLNDPLAPNCTGAGEPVPPATTYIDSGGDDDANGAALASFLGFLRDNYGVQRVHLVGHSDGGNWSRAAITQNGAYTGVTLQSLTTLGTPYTGAFSADIALATQGGKCDFKGIEQDICLGLIDIVDAVFKDMGPIATKQLTEDYLTSWNARQQIGACPVTTIGGTYLQIPLLPLTFYTPSDALVGQASALAKASKDLSFQPIPAPVIPNLQFGGLYPVVHSETLSFLTPANLLNQTGISAKVAAVVASTPAGGAACNVPSQVSGNPTAAASPRREAVRLPLRLMESSAGGSLPRPGREGIVATRPGTTLRCGKRVVPTTSLLGDARLRVGVTGSCKRRLKLSVPTEPRRVAAPGAVLVRSHPRNDVALRIAGTSLRVKVTGPQVTGLRVTASTGGKARRVRLDPKGRGKLPPITRDTTIRIVATTMPGSRSATATFVLPG